MNKIDPVTLAANVFIIALAIIVPIILVMLTTDFGVPMPGKCCVTDKLF